MPVYDGVMANFDEIVNEASATQTDAVATSTRRDLLGRSALVLALVASIIAIGLDVFGEYLPSLVETSDMDPIAAFDFFDVFRRFLIGLLGLAAVICAGISLRRQNRPRAVASAALALGSFHLVWVVAVIIASLFG